mmetsp:Transcript_74933/g.139845  ORF Transcript_74933/g.139845 Transcript_74933/m.139845 type:complete len:236 (+) Transcript_74933:83-790(+)
MNYSHDTEQELDWAADQLRRNKYQGSSLPDSPIRRVTTPLSSTRTPLTLTQGAPDLELLTAETFTLGSALSALAVHIHCEAECLRLCEKLIMVLSDRERLAVHAEFVELNGVEMVLNVLRRHSGEAAVAALRLLDKLSRTSARAICRADGVQVLMTLCQKDTCQLPELEVALRVLHGLSFDAEVKAQLDRRGVRNLAQSILEERPGDGYLQEDIHSIAMRLLHRIGDGRPSTGRP